MKKRPYLLLVLSILFFEFASFAQENVPPIGGWSMDEKGGNYIFKPEKTPGDTKEFIYDIMPPVRAEGLALDVWFNAAIDKDVQQSGYVLPAGTGNKNITTDQTICSFSSEITDKKGRSWYVTYISYQSGSNEYRLARILSSPNVKYYATNMRPVARHFGLLSRQTGSLAKATPAAATEKRENIVSATETATTNKGLKSTDIKGILIHFEYNYGAGGKMIRVYKPYLVLNEGSIYREPVASPYTFDAGMSKQNEPKKWGFWRLKGNSFIVEWVGKNEEEKWFKNWFWATPATKDEKIEGSYMTAAGKDDDNADKANVFKIIAFTNTGQFALTSAANNGNVNVSASDFSKKNEAGTYILNDYSIELHFNNGTVMRRTFYFYLQGKTHFGIGNNVYLPKQNGESAGNNN